MISTKETNDRRVMVGLLKLVGDAELDGVPFNNRFEHPEQQAAVQRLTANGLLVKTRSYPAEDGEAGGGMNLREHCLRNVAGALRDIARLDAFNGPLEDRTLDLPAAYIQLGRQHLHPPALHIGVGLDSSLLKFRGDQMLPPGDPTDPAVSQEIHGGYLTPSKTGRGKRTFRLTGHQSTGATAPSKGAQ